MFRSGLTTILGVLAAWGLGFVFFLLTANAYATYYYPGDPDPAHFDIGFAGLCAWLLVGLTGTVEVDPIGWAPNRVE